MRRHLALALAPLLATLAVGGSRADEPVDAEPVLEEGVGPEDYNAAGRDLNGRLKALGKAFARSDAGGLASLLAPELAWPVRSWRFERVEASLPAGVALEEWVDGEAAGAAPADLATLLLSWREGFDLVDEALFKIHLIDRVAADGAVEARARIEVVGSRPGGGRRVDAALLETLWTPAGEELRLAGLRLVEGETSTGPGDLFVEAAEAKGLTFYGHEDPRFVPPSDALRYQVIRHAVGGAAAGDADGDGWDDVVLTSGEDLRLFLNRGDGTFREATAEAGLDGVLHANAALFADLDDDGDQDLYVGRFYGHNLLFENTGGGRFRDATGGSGLEQDDMTAVLAAADLNGDGHLDLYLGRFLDARSEVPDAILYTRNGAPNRLYLGNGDLTFRDASAASGADDRGLTLGIGAADYDRDGDQDLYLSNDYGRNVLLRNRGDGTFEDAAVETGTLAVSGGMSASWGDVDNDGRLDLYVSSIRSNQRWFSQDVNIRGYVLNIVQSERRDRLQELFLDLRKHLGDDWDQVGRISLAGNYLLRQVEGGRFEDVSWAANARPQGWYWSSGFFDVDNDGDLDVLATCGWITGPKTDDL